MIDFNNLEDLTPYSLKASLFVHIRYIEKVLKMVKNPTFNKEIAQNLGTELIKLKQIQTDILLPECHVEICIQQYQEALGKIKSSFEQLDQKIDELNQNLTDENKIPNITPKLEWFHVDDQFLYQPIGMNGMAWLINYRMIQLQSLSTKDKVQEDLLDLLRELKESLSQYKSGSIAILENLDKNVADFMNQHSEIKDDLPWLLGIQKEAQIMIKKEKVIMLSNQLDRFDIELASKIDNRKLAYDRLRVQQAKTFNVEELPTPSTWRARALQGIKSFFDFGKGIRKQAYLRYMREENKKYKADIEKIELAHKKEFEEQTKEIKDNIEDIRKNTKRQDNSLMSIPTSFKEQEKMKIQIVKNKGMLIGGLAQNKVIELGSQAGLCHGFTKEWLLKMNDLSNLDEHLIIDNLNLYAKKANNELSAFINPINSLEISTKIYNLFNSQLEDSAHQEKIVKKDENFTVADEIFQRFEKLDPKSCILSIYKEGSNIGHALGVVQNSHGIWFHDSNMGCVFFPNEEGDAKNNFSKFFTQYVADEYPKYTRAAFTHIDNKVKDTLSIVEILPIFQSEKKSIKLEEAPSLITSEEKKGPPFRPK